jgi:hypothetical protein
MATLRSATLPPSQEELLAAVALDVQVLAQQEQNPLGDFKPRRSAGGWWPRRGVAADAGKKGGFWALAPSG